MGNPLELAELKEEIRDRFGPTTPIVENLFRVMDLRRVLKEFLVQQISVSNGQVFLLFHPESPVKVEQTARLIKQRNAAWPRMVAFLHTANKVGNAVGRSRATAALDS